MGAIQSAERALGARNQKEVACMLPPGPSARLEAVASREASGLRTLRKHAAHLREVPAEGMTATTSRETE